MLILIAVFPNAAFAEGLPSIPAMFSNFYEHGKIVIGFVRYAAYVMGAMISVGALLDFMKYSQNQVELRQPITKMAVAACLLALAPSINAAAATLSLQAVPNNDAMLSMFGGSAGSAVGGIFEGAFKGIIVFIKLVGHISLIKGFIALKNSQSRQGGQDTMGKALTFILGGVACIHLEPFVKAISNTFTPGLI